MSVRPIHFNLIEAAKNILALLIVLASFWFIENFMDKGFQKNSLFGLGFLVLFGLTLGRLCALIGLPRLTGYLAAGLLSGPSFLTIINDAQVEQLRLVNSLALALIALHAGSEFTKEMLTKNLKSLFYSTWTHIVIIGAGIILTLLIMQSHIDFLKKFELTSMLSIAAVFATLAVSKSPAAVMAILSETKIKNKLSDHALGIVVILDVVIIILFAIALAFARSLLSPGIPFSANSLFHLMGEIGASIAAGTFFGLFILLYLWLIDKERLLFLVAISYGVTALCSYLHYDTLLVFVVAGFTVTNFSRQSEKMIQSIESLSSVVMIAFFATAGASLHLNDLLNMWQLALILFLVRAVLTWVSEHAAHRMAGSDPVLRTYGFTPFISQAGLSIGLSMIIYDRVPSVGPQLATLAIAVVTMNEIFGPILFKWGLDRSEKMNQKSG